VVVGAGLELELELELELNSAPDAEIIEEAVA